MKVVTTHSLADNPADATEMHLHHHLHGPVNLTFIGAQVLTGTQSYRENGTQTQALSSSNNIDIQQHPDMTRYTF
jgi:hypothetical protein